MTSTNPGKLIRNGQPVYYAYINGVYVENKSSCSISGYIWKAKNMPNALPKRLLP